MSDLSRRWFLCLFGPAALALTRPLPPPEPIRPVPLVPVPAATPSNPIFSGEPGTWNDVLILDQRPSWRLRPGEKRWWRVVHEADAREAPQPTGLGE